MKRQGEYVKNIINGANYESFKPASLSDIASSFKKDNEIDELLIKIYENFAGIRKLSEYVKSTELFLYAYVLKEAIESSKIEGIECTMQDILSESYIKKNKKIDDIKEVVSNLNAINFAVKKMEDLPLCTRLYKEIHRELLKNVRGKNKNPGELRTTQNWIGGSSINGARFVPPNVNDMNESLGELDKYINDGQRKIDKLINCALIHYQFETIHPFLDGNGRLGRIIILLYLIREGLLQKPIVYLSYFLKMYQSEYYDKLMRVREDGDYEGYVKFFLRCLKEATLDVLKKIETLEKLHNDNISKLPKSDREKDTLKMVFNYIEENPIFSIKVAVDKTELAFNTVSDNIKKLKELKIVEDFIDASRNRIFIYRDLYNIISK